MRFNQISKKRILVLAACIVLFCYGFAWLFGSMTYHTNDDVSIQRYIARFTFDGMWWAPTWVSIILSYPLGVLSYFFPQVSWWYAASQCFVAVSMLVIHYIALRMAQIKNLPLWIALVFLALFDSVFSVISIAEIAFTIVPSVIGGAMIALAFYYPFVSERKRKYIVAGCGAALVVAVSHRWMSGTIAAIFVLLVIAMTLSKMYGMFSKKMLAGMVAVSVMVAVVVLGISWLNRTVNRITQGEEWVNYSSARSAWIDYAHDTYEENPELYEAAGWTEDTYYFASNWIFLPDEITEESFRYLAENSQSNPDNISIADNLKNAIQKVVSDPRMLHTGIVTLLVCGFILLLKLLEKDWIAALFLMMDMLACAVALVYLSCFVGRVIFRSVFVILYPTILIAIFIFIGNYQKKEGRIFAPTFFVGLAVVIAIWAGSFYNLTVILYAKQQGYEVYTREQLTLARYESENRDKTFITQGFRSITYKQVSTDQINNACAMGGSLWKSNYMKYFQKSNNIDQLNWTVFELPHVYFLGRLNMNTAYILDYLQREYDCKGVAVIEPIEDNYDIYCMKFVYEDQQSDFANIYEVDNGVFVEISD